MEKQIDQALANIQILADKLEGQQQCECIALDELNEFLIELMIDEDIWDIKENLHNGDTSFLYDVLLGAYWTPYAKLLNKSTGAIIKEFLERGCSESSEDFLHKLSLLDYDIDLKVKEFIDLVDAVVKEYL